MSQNLLFAWGCLLIPDSSDGLNVSSSGVDYVETTCLSLQSVLVIHRDPPPTPQMKFIQRDGRVELQQH